MRANHQPAARDPYHFGRIALALSLLPWMAWALMRTFQLSDGLFTGLLQLLIMLSVPAALILGAIGLYSDARRSFSLSALTVTLIYTLTFFVLLLKALAHKLLAPQ